MPFPILSRGTINRALRRLTTLLAEQSLRIGVELCHGRVFCIAFTTVRGLLDASGFVIPTGDTLRLIFQVGTEHGLPDDWFAQDLKFYLALGAAIGRPPLADFAPRIELLNIGAERLLALRMQACQAAATPDATDLAEALFLIKRVRLRSAEEVERLYKHHFPGCRLDSTLGPIPKLLGAPRARRLLSKSSLRVRCTRAAVALPQT